MKTALLIFAAVVWCGLNCVGQGAHLKAGDSLSIGFNGMGVCRPCAECGLAAGGAYVVFGADALGAGEGIRLDMFENDLVGAPIASRTYNATGPFLAVSVGAPGAWQDFQGLINVTMLSGEADLAYGEFDVFLGGNFSYCETIVAVPEPSVFASAAVAASIAAAMRVFRRRAT